ncbi:hypothetical protein KM043_012138 [Ampulex compressa]|nr:hypothetical protein KM043_012138 [Ampulex compressa]
MKTDFLIVRCNRWLVDGTEPLGSFRGKWDAIVKDLDTPARVLSPNKERCVSSRVESEEPRYREEIRGWSRAKYRGPSGIKASPNTGVRGWYGNGAGKREWRATSRKILRTCSKSVIIGGR